MEARQGCVGGGDTEDPAADLKTRNLPISAKVPPTFSTILAKWRSRAGLPQNN